MSAASILRFVTQFTAIYPRSIAKRFAAVVDVACLKGWYLVYGWTACLVEASISNSRTSVCRSLAMLDSYILYLFVQFTIPSTEASMIPA